MSLGPLAEKLAIVTGGARGIGGAISENLASKGANVVINYTSESSEKKAQELAQKLSEKYGVKTIVVQAKMGDSNAPQTILDAIKSSPHYAGKTLQIDILVNNAGIAGNDALGNIEKAEFDRQYSVNVLGPLLLVQAVQQYLPHDGSGRIINLSSVSASLGLPMQSIYAGTKAALDAMSRVWASELADRATSNCVNPGPVLTDMYDTTTYEFKEIMRPHIEHAPGMLAHDGAKKKGATAEDVANVVGLIALPDSRWTTGSVVSCNGGMFMGA